MHPLPVQAELPHGTPNSTVTKDAVGSPAVESALDSYAEYYSGPYLPDAVVGPTIHSNGRWPQMDAQHIFAMGGAAAEQIESGALTWREFDQYDTMSKEQVLATGAALNGLHKHFNTGTNFDPEATSRQNLHNQTVQPERLVSLTGGRRNSVVAASWAFLDAAADEASQKEGGRGALFDREALYDASPRSEVRALNELWQVAGKFLSSAPVNQASIPYRELISEIWNRPDLEEPGKRALIAEVRDAVKPMLRIGVEAHIRASLRDIRRSTGYKPSEAAVSAWLERIFI